MKNLVEPQQNNTHFPSSAEVVDETYKTSSAEETADLLDFQPS